MTNIEKIKQALLAQGFEAILIINPVNRLFATGFESSDGALLVTGQGAWFYTDSRYIEAAEAAITGAKVSMVTDASTYSSQISSVLIEHGITSLGFEDSSVTYSEYLNWTEKLSEAFTSSATKRGETKQHGLLPIKKLLSDLRRKKTAGDLEKLKKAQRIAEKSFEEVLPLISTDMTEKELTAELIYRLIRNGADDKSFDPIIVSGPKSSMPHGVPGAVKISKGFLTIDFGARLDGWCTDTTRTLCVGEPDETMKNIYETVLKAQEAGIKTARAGLKASDVDAAGRKVIEETGYGEYFGHGFGHGVGLEVHEAPTANRTSEDILAAGDVISAEPGIYLPGRCGVRIEDVIYITENGNENLTGLTKKLIIL